MPSVFRMWDPAGNLIIDESMRLGRIVGVAALTGGVNGSAVNAALTTGTPFWMLTCITSPLVRQPVISVSGSTISWDFGGTGGGLNWRLIYGVY